MSWLFVINEVSPDLETGVTRTIFIFSRKVALLRYKWKIHFNGTNKELNFYFTMLKYIWSKPGLLPTFIEKNAVFISSSDKVTSSKELSDLLRYISNGICDWHISRATFGPKCSLKLLTMVFWSKYSKYQISNIKYFLIK